MNVSVYCTESFKGWSMESPPLSLERRLTDDTFCWGSGGDSFFRQT